MSPQERYMATALDRVRNLMISLIVLQFIHNSFHVAMEVAAGKGT